MHALVVRTYDFGEADRIVVLLTREQGIVRGVAKGARRANSRFGSRLQPFVEINVQLYPGRNLATITEVDTVAFFAAGLIDDLQRYAAGCAVLEAVEKLAVEHSQSEELFDLAISALKALSQTADRGAAHGTDGGAAQAKLIVAGFLAQAMAAAGWEPSLYQCAQCGKPGPHHAFHPASGGAVCGMCRPPGSLEVDPEALHMLWLLAQDAFAAATELHTPQRALQVERMVRDYMHWHTERKIVSLNVLDQA